MDPVSKTPTEPIDYATLSAGYGALLAALVVTARDKGEQPVRPVELPLLGLATFSLAKLVTKEKVETWVRQPFLEEAPDGARRPKGRRMRYAIGELLSCSRCMGSWSAMGLISLRVLRPREAGIVLPLLATTAINDWLQSGFTALCAQSNLNQKRADAPPPEAGDSRVARFERARDDER